MVNKKHPCLSKRGGIWGLCILLLYTSPLPCLGNFNKAQELIYKIKEGLPRGTFIGAIGVDLNLDFNADPPFLFNLAQKKVSEQYVTLNNTTGELHTSATEIDREILCSDNSEIRACALSLDVLVLPQQYFQLVKVKVVIEDVNDNRPKFPSDEIILIVPENSLVNARYAVEQSAIDPDLGLNGVQTYWLVNDFGVFTLDVEENDGGELTPFLIVTETLDRETQAEYITDIIAEDGGTPPLLGAATLKIQISDVNDNCPKFTESHLNITVHGNTSKGAPLVRLHAYDPDLGANAQISYAYSERSVVELTIEENNPPNAFLTQFQATDQDSDSSGEVVYLLGGDAPGIFELDRVTGVLTVITSLDREEKETYRFIVRALDQGTPRRESIATVLLTVQDRNDNSPRFINKDFTFFVPENFPGYGEIGVLSVRDADAGENGWVALSILNGTDIFMIDTGRGILRAKTSLDREQQGTYQLWIEAVDGGEPALSSVTMVTVLLLDVNDNPPIVLFPQSNLSYMLVLPSTLPGTSITEVYAVDKDTGMNAVIAYSIIKRKGGEPGSFTIDAQTGNITLKRELSNRGAQCL
uniref:Cadherin domain-containing protein n=1 Tax=Knipowitschia caucasica TaxID=637954 RepID=A0AAV2LSN6_KNICA